MTDKELRKLSRFQLLELLVIQTARADQLQEQLEQAQKQLDDKEIRMTVIGSIAEATVQFTGIMENAQKTADMYLASVEKRIEEMEAEARARADAMVEQARMEALRIQKEAKKSSILRKRSEQ